MDRTCSHSTPGSQEVSYYRRLWEGCLVLVDFENGQSREQEDRGPRAHTWENMVSSQGRPGV